MIKVLFPNALLTVDQLISRLRVQNLRVVDKFVVLSPLKQVLIVLLSVSDHSRQIVDSLPLLNATNALKLILNWTLAAQTLPFAKVLLPLFFVRTEQGFNSFHVSRVLDLFRLIARSFGTFIAATSQHRG